MTRILLGTAAVAVGLAAATADRPARTAVPPPCGVGDGDERDQVEALDARFDAISRRLDAKGRVVDAVREGRLDRAAGVDLFREMIVADPELLELLRTRFPGRTDAELAEENFARHYSVTPATE